MNDVIEEALNNDPIITRSLKFRHDCEKALQTYEEIVKDMKRHAKQTKVTYYFKN